MGLKVYHTFLDVSYRKAGKYLVLKIFIKTRLTPNTITGLGFLIMLVSAWFFSMGVYLYIILGMILFQLAQILDYSDGELARAKNMVSKHGDWVDRISDLAKESFVLFGITFGIYRMLVIPTITVWIFGILAIASIQFRVFMLHVNPLCFPISSRKKIRKELGLFYKLVSYSWNIVSLSIILFAILNMMYIYLIIFASYNLLWCVASFVYLNFKYRKLYGVKK